MATFKSIAQITATLSDHLGKITPKERNVLDTILVFVLGLTPPVLSIWVMQKAKERAQVRLRAAAQAQVVTGLQTQPWSLDQYYLEGVGYLIGDISCRFNAHSPYIRCAVNPEGPCKECRYYEPKE
jgi:hypothetical protein